MSENRGIFSLNEFYDLQVSGETSKILDVFRYVNQTAGITPVTGTEYGYLGGGRQDTPAPWNATSVVDRIDFASDTSTASPRGNLDLGVAKSGSFSSSSYGYIVGGDYGGPSPSKTSNTQRVDYASDSSTASPKGKLTDTGYNISGVGDNNFGYSVGGQRSGISSKVDRLDYSNDTAAAVAKGTLSETRYGNGSTGTNFYGYTAGGYTGSNFTSKSDRIDYSNDTATASPKGPLTSAKYLAGAAGNADYGYWAGGAPGVGGTTYVDRLDWSNDTAAAVAKGPLSSARRYVGATGNASYGYWMGGADSTTSPPARSIVDRIDYSNDTPTASPKGNLSSAKRCVTNNGFGSRTNTLYQDQKFLIPASRTESGTVPAGTDYGYICGGNPSPAGGTRIFRLDFNNDTTTASPKGGMNVNRFATDAVSNTTHGYICGGYSSPGNGNISSIDRIDYSDDTTTASPKGNLNLSGNNWAAAGNASYGWLVAGEGPGYRTAVSRIDYSNDDTTTNLRTNTDNKTRLASVGNPNYGYFAGGQSPVTSRVVRLDYANDTTWGTTKGPLANGTGYYQMGAGNISYGYIAGGDPSRSSVTRIDYSNDSAVTSPKGNLSANMWNDASTANSSYGYFAPGPSGQPDKRSMDRIDFANDTATASPRGNIINDADNRMGTSSRENGLPTTAPGPVTIDKGADGYTTSTPTAAANLGYFAGGYNYNATGNQTTKVDRIDFSNDTATAVEKGNLSNNPGQIISASSNGTHGYLAGGHVVPVKSTISRIDYANDTAQAAVKGPLSIARGASSGFGNNDYGYHVGGVNFLTPVGYSTVDRVDYSNDTPTASPKGSLSATNAYQAGAGNLNYGYYVGESVPGAWGPSKSKVQRVDYSNDTATASPKGNMNNSKATRAAVSNSDYGWFTTGYPTTSQTSRIDYSSDTSTASPKGNFWTAAYKADGTGNPNYGYIAVGFTPAGSTSGQTTIGRIDYSNDTATASQKGTTTMPKAIGATGVSAADNGRNPVVTSYIPRIRWVDSASPVTAGTPYGYSAGGASPGQPITSRIDRLDFSNDTANTVAKGNLVSMHPSAGYAGKDMAAALGNTNFAYFAGGNIYPAPDTSQVSRLDYANDSTDCVSKGTLSQSRKSVGGTGNTNFGYVTGGTGSLSYVDRIDYSNDTSTAASKGSLTLGVTAPAGAGTLDFGYFSGGDAPGSPGSKTIIQRIDYSNDTANTSPKGNLVTQTVRHGNTGNKNFGYHSGGYTGSGYTSNVERTTYSNDTATGSPKGPLTSTNAQYGATGNQTGGYIMGGDRSGYTSTIEKIDYSNDTATATAKGNLDRNVYSNFATSSQINGFEEIVAPVQLPFPYPQQSARPPMSLTLESSDSSRVGDTTSVQNTWWGTQTYDASLITNIGQQSYQGFYAFTAGKACTITATLGGAAGWSNSRGRSITATFSVSAGARIVFFAGKPTEKYTSGQEVGAAGGASCLMIYDTSASSDDDYVNGFYPLIIAAGGSAAGNTPSTKAEDNFRTIEAVPLTTTTDYTQSNLVDFRKASGNTNVPAPSPGSQSDFDGGWGRNGTQSGGAGWKYAAIGYPGSIADDGNAVGLAYGATGQLKQGSNGADGGFGGGGGDGDGNYYGAGGGGYYGGFESSGGQQTGSAYYTYGGDTNGGNSFDDRGGPLSFVHSSGTSITDNGLHGETSAWNDQDNADQIKGRVHLVISEI